MHEYTIFNGKFIGDFEGLYRSFKDPFTQSKKEKFETSKAAIINYCNLLQEKQKKKINYSGNRLWVWAVNRKTSQIRF